LLLGADDLLYALERGRLLAQALPRKKRGQRKRDNKQHQPGAEQVQPRQVFFVGNQRHAAVKDSKRQFIGAQGHVSPKKGDLGQGKPAITP
jgi:hypothetical protein